MNTEKERIAIERLRTFAPKDGDSYFLCYSGEKDSDCIRILCQLAGVPHEVHHSLTTVDAPETVQYIKTIPGVIIDRAAWYEANHLRQEIESIDAEMRVRQHERCTRKRQERRRRHG